jgi:hypothetical protein
MQDHSTRDPPSHKRPETLPRHPTLLAPPLQRAGPAPDDLGPKALQAIDVAGYRMVVEPSLVQRTSTTSRLRPLSRASAAEAPPVRL